MRAAPEVDPYIAMVRETMYVSGGWSSSVEKVLREALQHAFDSGLEAAMQTNGHFRVVRWLYINGAIPARHVRKVAKDCQMVRETASRHISRLVREGLADGHRGVGYRLSEAGLEYARRLDHLADEDERKALRREVLSNASADSRRRER